MKYYEYFIINNQNNVRINNITYCATKVKQKFVKIILIGKHILDIKNVTKESTYDIDFLYLLEYNAKGKGEN